MQQLDQLQRQIGTLSAELRILEKRKNDLFSELEHIEFSKKEEKEQYTREIKNLVKTRDDLMVQVEELKEGKNVLIDSYEIAKKELSNYKERELRDINKRVDESRYTAEAISAEAISRKNEAETLMFKAHQKEQELLQREKTLFIQATELAEQSQSLENRLRNDVERHQKAEEHYRMLTEEITRLKDTIEFLTDERVSLEMKIKNDREQNAQERQLLNERFQEVERKELANQNRTEILNQKIIELRDQETLLKDRQGQLERTIAEFRGKGVTI